MSTLIKKNKKWIAQISIDRIQIYLGRYDTIEEAKNIRIKKANEVFGIYKNSCEN